MIFDNITLVGFLLFIAVAYSLFRICKKGGCRTFR